MCCGKKRKELSKTKTIAKPKEKKKVNRVNVIARLIEKMQS